MPLTASITPPKRICFPLAALRLKALLLPEGLILKSVPLLKNVTSRIAETMFAIALSPAIVIDPFELFKKFVSINVEVEPA